MHVRRILTGLWRDESGVTAIEYALVTCLVSIVAIGMWNYVSSSLSGVFNQVGSSM